jgi:hypothetical protein
MKLRLLSLVVLGLAIGAAVARDTNAVPPAQGPAGGQGERGGRGRGDWGGGGGWGMMGGGRGTVGTVTEVAADHYTIKTESGESYTVHYSVNTRIMKQMVRRRKLGEARSDADEQPSAPQPLKPTDIKVGDVIATNGEMDTSTKSVGAVFIVQIDPERAKQMREMEASYGKTWLMGKVTAVDGVKVTIQSARDHTARSFVADENTTFRKRRDPITLADIQVGDVIRVEGTAKEGTFVATTVGDMGAPSPEGAPTVPRATPPQ